MNTNDNIQNFMLFPGFLDDPKTKNLTFPELRAKCNEHSQKGNIQEAIRFAKVAAIHFGLDGIMLYLPLQCQYIHALYNDDEIIQQDSQKTLALIFFAEAQANNKSDKKDILFELEQLKCSLLTITQDKNFIVDQAHQIADEMLIYKHI